MKFITIVIFSSFLLSCNFKKAFEKVDKINSDLRSTFNCQNISTGISWGTDEENNKISVSFYNFNLDSLSYSDLSNLASRVGARVCQNNKDLKSVDYIEVLFSKEQYPDKANDLVSFKFKNSCTP